MRKVLLTILATAVLAGCSKDDVIKSFPQQEIAFGNVFVDNATKADPSYTNDNFDMFFVYGNVKGNKGTVNIYNGAAVSNTSGVWNCEITQYWIPKCTYDFVAVSDAGAKNANGDVCVTVSTTDGLPSEISYDVTCQKDLLYAELKGDEQSIKTDEIGTPSTGVTDGVVNPVSFTFNHLLSKVKFTFTNGFPENSGVQLYVTDIKITNAAKQGTYNISNAQDNNAATLPWSVSDYYNGDNGDFIDFGSAGTEEDPILTTDNGSKSSSINAMLIPNTQSFSIAFTVKNTMNTNENSLTATTREITLEPGVFYNFTAKLTPEKVQGVVPISFAINKGGWDGSLIPVGPEYNVTVIE